jgi:hypothetical protein
MWKAHHLATLSCVEEPDLIERRDKLEPASRVPLLTIGLASEEALHGLRLRFPVLTACQDVASRSLRRLGEVWRFIATPQAGYCWRERSLAQRLGHSVP